MFINLEDSGRLVERKQQAYRREAEEYRLEKELDGHQTAGVTATRAGIAFAGLIVLLIMASQYVTL
jgi:hypothetical protein